MDFRDTPEDAAFRREVRDYVNAVSSTIAGGTSEIQRNIIATSAAWVCLGTSATSLPAFGGIAERGLAQA